MLLVMRLDGSANGTVAVGSPYEDGAMIAGGSEVVVLFEVVDAPVYYEITATGMDSGVAAASVQLVELTVERNEIFVKEWHAAPDSFAASGWLQPGQYDFAGAGTTLMGAGTHHTDRERSAKGALSFSYVFRILEDEPKQEEEP